jgi:mannose-6-phosphate isomerase class I
MTNSSNFEKYPSVPVPFGEEECLIGWPAIRERLRGCQSYRRIAIECYPGVHIPVVCEELTGSSSPARVIRSAESMLPGPVIERKFASLLGDDPVFGRLSTAQLEDFFDPEKVASVRSEIAGASGPVVVLGIGATVLLPDFDLLVYIDVSRWEIQQRQRRGDASSIGLSDAKTSAAALYKRGYFLDWRAADRKKHDLYRRIDFVIDENRPDRPAMVSGDVLRSSLAHVVRQPFSVVPFFDPGPWGGQWMRRKFDLPDGPPNYAWCFNCVPEENSLALQFGSRHFELPALTLVHEHPQELLGADVFRRFGAEFPIRFDYLDTIEGGNLSLQVHPLRRYIQENFGISYTQDESYYMLDAEPDATVFLGLRDGIDPRDMAAKLKAAQQGGGAFPAEQFVNVWPARKHDHFSIPAGTIHCSGRNSMVLEISATPYIFTFKLWDWGRLGLDGRPRPIHLDRGLANIQWDRTTDWIREHLISKTETVASGEGWREERTGLHPLEFLETRRHWFTAPVKHDTHGNLNVLNLVEGDAAIVESPCGGFAPFTVHYAETFIIPAGVGPYTIRPASATSQPLATIKAYVREDA